MLPVESAFEFYVDLDGKPLDNGYIYFGVANQNPVISPITVYWDAAGTQPAAQPLRTQDGYIVRNGTPANVFYTGSYSQLVQNKRHSQIYYAPSSDDYSIATYVQNVLLTNLANIGATLIGFVQTGANAVIRTVANKLSDIYSSGDHSSESGTRDASVAARSGFWADQLPAPRIRRVPGRLFVGDGVAASGNSTQTVGHESWLFDSFGAYWLERGAQVLMLPESPGYIGSVGAARTSTADTSAGVAIGNASIAWNDKTVGGTLLAWAHYFEAVVEPGAGQTYAAEVSVKNKSSNSIRNPYAQVSDGGIGWWFAGGGDPSYGGAPANPSNVAIAIGKNGHTWNTGICFDSNGITGSDGVTGYGSAIKMGKGHIIDWWCDASNLGAQITSSVSTGAGKTKRLEFTDASMLLGNAVNNSLFNFSMGTTQVNGFQFAATNTGAGQVTMLAAGPDANLDFRIFPQGTGLLKYGVFSAGSFTSNGCIFIKTEDGVSRRVLVAA